MDSLITKLINMAIIVVTIAAIWKMTKAYLYGSSKVQVEIKNFLIVLIVLGALPFMSDAAPAIGENLVKPVVSIVKSVSTSISSDLKVD